MHKAESIKEIGLLITFDRKTDSESLVKWLILLTLLQVQSKYQCTQQWFQTLENTQKATQ